MMATLVLMVGLPGSGKTTVAKQLERERPALRLTPDDWIGPLFGSDLSQATLDAARDPVETIQWHVAARALTLGVDVVLDFGFWSRAERDLYRAMAAALGARSEIQFLDVSGDVLSARIAARNAERAVHSFFVSEAQLALWSSLFEPPTQDELQPRE